MPEKTKLEKLGTAAGIWGAILSTVLGVLMYRDRIEYLDSEIGVPPENKRGTERDAIIYNHGGSRIWVQEVQLRFYHSNSYSIFYLLPARKGPLAIESGSLHPFAFDTNESALSANLEIKGPKVRTSENMGETQSVYVITGRKNHFERRVNFEVKHN
jgi:hypothetical protein